MRDGMRVGLAGGGDGAGVRRDIKFRLAASY